MYIFLLLAPILLVLLCVKGKRKTTDFYGLSHYHYAHRGLCSADAPENSLAAFRLAVQHGYGAELDVRLSRDNVPIVLHDGSLERIAGMKKQVCDMTAAELTACGIAGTQEKIPTLQTVLPLFAGKTPLMIELKTQDGNYAELTKRVCEQLDAFPNLQFCIESFDPRVLRWLKKHRSEIVRGQLAGHFGIHLLANFWTQPHFAACRFEKRNTLLPFLCRKVWKMQEVSWTLHEAEKAEKALGDGAMIVFEDFIP